MASVKSHLKLCTFDVTNTLLKFRISVGEQYAKVGHIYNIKRDPGKLNAAFLQHWKSMNLNYPNFGKAIGLESQLWWKQLVQKTFSTDEEQLTSKQLDSMCDHLYHLYKSDACWSVVPGAKLLLQNLKSNDITLGVISNFDERLDSVLSSTGLKKYFDFILASYVVGIAKPSEQIFSLALNQISGMSSDSAVHIGDNVTLDYLAAKNAGWNALLIADQTEEELSGVDPKDVVKNISEVEKRLLS